MSPTRVRSGSSDSTCWTAVRWAATSPSSQHVSRTNKTAGGGAGARGSAYSSVVYDGKSSAGSAVSLTPA